MSQTSETSFSAWGGFSRTKVGENNVETMTTEEHAENPRVLRNRGGKMTMLMYSVLYRHI